MASKISINLDTSKENFLVAKCKQNDDLTLEAYIYGNGAELDLTNKDIIIQALKADNTYIIQNTEIVKENNKILAELDRDFSRVSGTTKIEILLVESGKQNTTFSFYLEVSASVISGAVESSNTVTILEALDNKIIETGQVLVEAIQVKEDTEQLIESGGAATTGDIANINAQLEHIVENIKDISYNVKDFGAKGDGITDDLESINNAINTISLNGGGTLIFPQSTSDYIVSNYVETKDNVVLQWTGSSFLKLSKATTIGGMFSGGGNVILINAKLDGNNIPSQNGLGSVGGKSNYVINGATLKNFKREPIYGGGKAVSFQLGVDGAIVNNIIIDNCSVALDTHGQYTENKYAKNIIFGNVILNNCEEIYSNYDLGGVYNSSQYQNVLISNIVARNCGKSADDTGLNGGCIVVERGGYAKIDNIQIINDSSYGKIGGVFRGKGYHLEISNITFIGDCEALINATNATSIAPIIPNNTIPLEGLIVSNLKHIGNTNYVVKSDSANRLINCFFNKIYVDKVLVSILDTNAGGSQTSWGEFIQSSTLKTRSGKFNFLKAYIDNDFNGASLFQSADPQRICKTVFGISGTSGVIGTEEDIDLLLRRNNLNVASLTAQGFKIEHHTWNGRHLILGNYHIWVNTLTGRLMIKNGAPTSETDGSEM